MDVLRAVAGVAMAIFMMVAPQLGVPFLSNVPGLPGSGPHLDDLKVDVRVDAPLRLVTLDADGQSAALRVLWAEVEGQKLERTGQGQGKVDQLRFAVAGAGALRVGNGTQRLTPGDEVNVSGFEGRWAFGPGGMVGLLRLDGLVVSARLGQPGLGALGTGHEELAAPGALAEQLASNVTVRAGRSAFVSTAADGGDGTVVKHIHARDVRINGARVDGTRWGEGALDSISFTTNAPASLVGAEGNRSLPRDARVDVTDFIGDYVLFFVGRDEGRLALEGYAGGLAVGQAAQAPAPTSGGNQPPVAGFQANPTAPLTGQSVKFTDLSQDPDGVVLQRAWRFGDGAGSAEKNPSHAFDAPGAYTVTLTVTDDHFVAASTTSVLQVLNRPPVVAFAANPGKPSVLDHVQFVDQSLDPDGRLASWHWTFGDGVSSEEQNPQHQFPRVGVYNVTLSVLDDRGAQQVLSQVLKVVNLPPQAKFSWQPGDPRSGTAVRFVDQSTDQDGTIVARRWDFGDGGTSTEPSPEHTFTAKGPQRVTLGVTDDQGATNQYDSTVNVLNSPPRADFNVSPDPPTEGNPARFTDLSKDPDGRVVEWAWSFGDGSLSAQSSPTHTFTQGGDIAVTLTAKDDDGQRSTVMKTFHINRKPLAAWSMLPASPTTQTPVRFNESSVDPDGSIASWRWEFGDGNTSADRTPTHAFSRAGAYHTRLTVTDDQGGWGVLERVITVANAAPIVDFAFTPEHPSTNDVVQFNDTSTDPDGVLRHWTWQFGDGSGSVGRQVTKRFAQGGAFPVTLTVTDESGQSSSMVKVLAVDNAPQASFTYLPAQPTTASLVQFTDTSTDDQRVASWRWDFGDGATSDLRHPTHRFTATGIYLVRLAVTDTDGALGAVAKPLTVGDQAPGVDFGFAPAMPRSGQSVQFTDLSTDSDGSVVRWAWEFGDGGTSSARHAQHTFSQPGLYTVRLTATDDGGNAAQASKPIRVLSGDALGVFLRVVYPDGQPVDLARPGIVLTLKEQGTGVYARDVQLGRDGTAQGTFEAGQWSPTDNVLARLSYPAGGVEQGATLPLTRADLGQVVLDVHLQGVVQLVRGTAAGGRERVYGSPTEAVRGAVVATWSDGTPARTAQSAVSFAYQELGLSRLLVDLSGTPGGAQSGPVDAQGMLPFQVPFTIGSPDSGTYLPGQYRIDAKAIVAGVNGRVYQVGQVLVFTESPAGLL